MMNPGATIHGVPRERVEVTARKALNRAPVILAAAGCQLTCPEADEYEQAYGPENWQESVR